MQLRSLTMHVVLGMIDCDYVVLFFYLEFTVCKCILHMKNPAKSTSELAITNEIRDKTPGFLNGL